MKQKNMLSIFLSTLALIALSACGGGGGDDSSSGTPAVTGQFIDAPVQGLGYSCSSGKSGVTNANGEYTCNSGDDVTFSINGAVIGTVAVQVTAITPYTLFPNNTTAAINLARLLQSLDSSSDDGAIVINTALEVNVPADVDFTAPDFEARLETALAITLVSSQEAKAKMNEAIVAVGGTVPEPTPTPIEPEPTPTPTPTPVEPEPTPTPVEPEPTEPAPVANENQSQSDFDTSNAIEDPNACIINSTYKNTMEHSSFDPTGAVDAEHGISIASLLRYDTDIQKTNVAIYYPDLIATPVGTQSTLNEDYFRLSFDQSWPANTNRTIYVRTPRGIETGYFECIRYTLSVDTESIVGQKVYRTTTPEPTPVEPEPINSAPVANAGADQTINLNNNVMFDASKSSDDGTIVSYEWKEGNMILSTTSSFSKSDFSVGIHTITLTVTDNDGLTATDTIVVTVNYGYDRIDGEKLVFIEESSRIVEASGWYYDTYSSEWSETKNYIKPYDFVIFSYLTEQNFLWMQFSTVIHNGIKYYIFMHEKKYYYYRYPTIKVDLQIREKIEYAILTEENYNTLKNDIINGTNGNTNMLIRLSGSSVYSYGDTELLDSIKNSLDDNSGFYSKYFSYNSFTYNGRNYVRFKLPTSSYPLELENSYFEIETSSFQLLFNNINN